MSLTNAKEELLKEFCLIGKTVDDILLISIDYIHKKKTITKIDELDFNYDDSYGTQHINGVVLFKDNTWLERAEYDGSEWWEYKSFQRILERLEDLK